MLHIGWPRILLRLVPMVTMWRNQKRHDGTLWERSASLSPSFFLAYLMQVAVQSCSWLVTWLWKESCAK